MDYHNISVSLC